MGAPVAWMKSLGADAAAWAKFTTSLQRKKVVLVEEKCEPGIPGLVLVSTVGDEVVEEISRCVCQCGSPVSVIALRRSSLGNGGSWRLIQAGASDVFVVEDDETREMQRLELCEWDQRVVWVDAARRLVHGVEQAAQFRRARRNDRRQNHESSLRRHGLLIEYLIACRLVMRNVVHVMP